MNYLYQSPKVNALLPFRVTLTRLLLVAVFATSLSFASSAQELVFQNPTLISGTSGQDDAKYRFPGVAAGIDAIVKIKGRSGSDVVLQDIDVTSTGWGKAFQPQLGVITDVIGIREWWMEFELTFVKVGTETQADVNKFDITALDIDGDGLTIREYVEFYKAKTSFLETITQLIATPLGSSGGEKDYRYTGPILNFLNIDTAGTLVMATGKFENKNKIKFKIGGKSTGLGTSNAGMRFNSLWFRSFNYTAPRTLPITLSSFEASLINKKIALSWTTEQEKNASHFTIERSTDGKEFTDAGIVFTEGNSEVSRSYSFKDPISTAGKGILYYRLKLVDLDGQFEYSQIRILKLGVSDGKLELSAFPNPVVKELRITIPESWQNRQVVYELYTGDGQLLKRFLNKSATQTEIINMEFYQPGIYLVKALNEKEIATQRIIKRR
ncbi:MAG: T9SS type A sorting domain-containing protein [Chitinophagaceae bacterium]